MNLQQLLKLVPKPLLKKMINEQLKPGIVALLDMAKKGETLQEGETSIQVLTIETRDCKVFAVVVAVDDDLQIKRKIKKYDIDHLIDSIDLNNI